MSIHIEGRRWFQKTYGQTYNTVRIFKDGKQVAYLPIEYGYGEFYLQRARTGANVPAFTGADGRGFKERRDYGTKDDKVQVNF